MSTPPCARASPRLRARAVPVMSMPRAKAALRTIARALRGIRRAFDSSSEDDDASEPTGQRESRRTPNPHTPRKTRKNGYESDGNSSWLVSDDSSVDDDASYRGSSSDDDDDVVEKTSTPESRRRVLRRRHRRDARETRAEEARAREFPSPGKGKRTVFVAKGSHEKPTRYDYRSRVKGVTGFEKLSDDDVDSGDTVRDFLASDDEDVGEEGESSGATAKIPASSMSSSESLSASSKGEEAVDEEEEEPPIVARRHRAKRKKTLDEDDEVVYQPASKRASSRVEAKEKQRRDVLLLRSIDLKNRTLIRDEEDSDDDDIDDDGRKTGDYDEISDSFVVSDDSDGDIRIMNRMDAHRRLIKFGPEAEAALRADDWSAFVKAISRDRRDDAPRLGLTLVAAATHNAVKMCAKILAKGMRTDRCVADKKSKRPHLSDVAEAMHEACALGHVEFMRAVKDCIGIAQYCRGVAGGWPRSHQDGTLVHSAAANTKQSLATLEEAMLAESAPGVHEEQTSHTAIPGVFDQSAEEGQSPLMIAASAGPGWEFACKALIAHAAKCGSHKVRTLIRMKQAEDGSTAIHAAAASGAEDSLKLMIQSEPSCIHVKDYAGSTPLHYAAAEGATRTLALLLRNGADRLSMDKKGWIPLMYANFSHERNAVLCLLDDLLAMQLKMLNTIKDIDSRQQVVQVFTMLATIPKYYDVLNAYVANDIRILDKELNFLIQAGSTILNLQNRLAYVRSKVQVKQSLWFMVHGHRDHVWKDILDCHRENRRIFRGGMVAWAIDKESSGPGIGQELRTLLATELCDYSNPIALFEPCAEDVQTYRLRKDLSPTMLIPCASNAVIQGPSRNIERELEVFGELLGYCFAYELLLPISFSSVFMNRIIFGATQPRYTMNDLDEVDPMFASSLKKLLKEPGAENLCLDFMAPRSNGVCDELKPGGADIEVNDENKAEYVELMLQHTMKNTINDDYVGSIRTGFKQVVSLNALSLLKANEIALAICGSSTIDVDDWIKHANVVDYEKKSEWFWNVIRRMNEEDRSLVLAFSTGSARLPTGGFAALRRPWCLTFTRSYDASKSDDSLPRAATCVNQLIMPGYSSEDVLEQRLLTAVRHGSKGFAMA